MELSEGLGDQLSNRVEQVITEVENNTNFDHIDGNVLSCILKMVYCCGLYRQEIGWLTLGNIRDNDNEIIEEINDSSLIVFLLVDTDCKILLSKYVVQHILRPHLDHLRFSNGYNVGSNDLLFPQKNKSKYHQKALSRNLEKFTQDFAFIEVRKAGKGKYFREIGKGDVLIPDEMTSYRIKIQPGDGIKFQKSIRKRTGNSLGDLSCAAGRYIRDHGLINYLQNIEKFIMRLFREITKGDMFWALYMACERISCFTNMTAGKIKELRDEFFNAVERQEVFNEDEAKRIERAERKAQYTAALQEIKDELFDTVQKEKESNVDESVKMMQLTFSYTVMKDKISCCKDTKTTLKNYFRTGFLINHGIKFDPTTGEPNKGIEEEPPKGIKKSYAALLSPERLRELNTPCQDEEEQKALYEMCKEAKNSAEQLEEYFYGKKDDSCSDDEKQ